MWPNPQETANLVTLTEEILNGKIHFLNSVMYLLETEISCITERSVSIILGKYKGRSKVLISL